MYLSLIAQSFLIWNANTSDKSIKNDKNTEKEASISSVAWLSVLVWTRFGGSSAYNLYDDLGYIRDKSVFLWY